MLSDLSQWHDTIHLQKEGSEGVFVECYCERSLSPPPGRVSQDWQEWSTTSLCIFVVTLTCLNLVWTHQCFFFILLHLLVDYSSLRYIWEEWVSQLGCGDGSWCYIILLIMRASQSFLKRGPAKFRHHVSDARFPGVIPHYESGCPSLYHISNILVFLVVPGCHAMEAYSRWGLTNVLVESFLNCFRAVIEVPSDEV